MGFAEFTAARSVAVVGLSERNRIARITVENLTSRGFPGRVVGLHPRGGEVAGVLALRELDEPVDLAVLCLGARRLSAAVRDLAGRGVRRFVIPGAGANEGGREIDADLRATVDELGVEVVGPNCMGFVSMPTRCVPYVGSLDPGFRGGTVGLCSQSGSVCELFTALTDRVGFSHVVSVGNEMTLDLADVLRFLAADAETRAIGLFIEGVRRPELFREALRLAAGAGKPVVALKVGASELAGAGTEAHTGVLAGDARVFSAVLRDGGAMEVRDLDELVAALELLGKDLRRPPGRVVVAGDSGGEGNLVADRASAAGVELPQLRGETADALRARFPGLADPANPLDLWALDDPEPAYSDGVRILLEHEPHLVLLALDKFLARTEPERAFVRAAVEGVDAPGAVALMACGGGDQADPEIVSICWERRIPVLRGAGASLRSLAGLDRWERWRRRQVTSRTSLPAPPMAAETLTEHAAKRLLAAAGIAVTRETEAADAEAAVASARAIGFPVVLKGVGMAHKTEAHGVRLNLRDDRSVRSAAADLLALAPRVLVAEQVEGHLELIASGFRDEQFGPCALLGLGGVWTEVFGRAAVIAGPGSAETVRRALEAVSWGRLLLEGGRARRFPLEAVTEVVLRLVDIVEGTDLDTIEINPLTVRESDVVAVDALVVPAKGAR